MVNLIQRGYVVIGGITYTIELVDVCDLNGDRNVQGTITYSKCLIEILKGSDEQRALQTLIHEIVHGMLREASLETQNDDEDFVDRFSKQLYLFLKENV